MENILSLNPRSSGGLRELFARAGRALVEPTRFFRFDFPVLNVSQSLAFGIGHAWAASVAAFFVQTINSILFARLLDSWLQRLLAAEGGLELWGLSGRGFILNAGATLLAPFLFLGQALLGSVALLIFARLLIVDRPPPQDAALSSPATTRTPEPVNFSAMLRLRSVAFVSEWYGLVPVFGGLLALVVRTVLLVTGVRERFGVSTRRACAVVLGPYLFLGVIALGLGLIALVALSQLPLGDMLGMDAGF